MSEPLEFRVRWLERRSGSPAERESFAEVDIRLRELALTELEDVAVGTVRTGARLSVLHLARWWAANFWRLRWEPRPQHPDADWRLAHELGGAGGGFLWPALQFSSDGETVALSLHDTLGAAAPIRYLRRVEATVSALDFERAGDRLLASLLERLHVRGAPAPELAELWQEVQAERHDAELTTLRRREALLGLDPAERPADALRALARDGAWLGEAALDETLAAVRAAGIERTLSQLADWHQTAASAVEPGAVAAVASAWDAEHCGQAEPWQRGAALAAVARRVLGVGADESIASDRLAQWLGPQCLQARGVNGPLAAGFRVAAAGDARWTFVPRRPHPLSRRFELARLMAEMVLAPAADTALPITAGATVRQKIQRAFAQEFLCPVAALQRALPLPYPSDDDIEDVAARYAVSERTVRSALVNHRLVGRDYLPFGSAVA